MTAQEFLGTTMGMLTYCGRWLLNPNQDPSKGSDTAVKSSLTVGKKAQSQFLLLGMLLRETEGKLRTPVDSIHHFPNAEEDLQLSNAMADYNWCHPDDLRQST
jgi:hypothetical protein